MVLIGAASSARATMVNQVGSGTDICSIIARANVMTPADITARLSKVSAESDLSRALGRIAAVSNSFRFQYRADRSSLRLGRILHGNHARGALTPSQYRL